MIATDEELSKTHRYHQIIANRRERLETLIEDAQKQLDLLNRGERYYLAALAYKESITPEEFIEERRQQLVHIASIVGHYLSNHGMVK